MSTNDYKPAAAAVWSAIFKFANITIILFLPWGIWVTRTLFSFEREVAMALQIQSAIAAHAAKISQHDLALQDLQSWRAIGPRFTPTDADNLRLKILNETQSAMALSLADISAKLSSIQRDALESQILLKQHIASHAK